MPNVDLEFRFFFHQLDFLRFQLLIVALSVSTEHLLFVQYKTKTKNFVDLMVFFRGFSKFYKNQIGRLDKQSIYIINC